MVLPLYLTSPLMHGELVKTAQRRLKNSKYGNFHPGVVDGVYGETSAAATRRAKWWLGFPKSKISGSYGKPLHQYLGGDRLLPVWYQIRRVRRLKAAQPPMRVKAYRYAKSQIGVKEYPAGSNRVKFSAWYGFTGAWCAMFLTWCYVQAGSKKFLRGSRWSYTPYLQYAINHGYYGMRALTRAEVKTGDIVLYDWTRNGVPDHVGLFEKWIDFPNTFYAIEGNTAIGNDSNGGEVMRRVRSAALVSCWGRCSS
jgi:hypothetical protein